MFQPVPVLVTVKKKRNNSNQYKTQSSGEDGLYPTNYRNKYKVLIMLNVFKESCGVL